MKICKYFIVLIILVLFNSCTWLKSPLGILKGNYLFNKGEDVLAVYNYLKTLDYKNENEESWILYNLGTVYLSLGESEPGIEILKRTRIESIQDQINRQYSELYFRIEFNMGVAFYDKGKFSDAAVCFVRALRIKPNSWDAKINLELTLDAMQGGVGLKPLKQERESREQALPSLEQVHSEEVPAWVSSEISEEYPMDW